MSVTRPKPRIVVIVGPTASGKSALGIRLAKAFGGEIVSADSRQFYRGMEVGADTVTGTPRTVGGFRTVVAEGIPHHLVSFRSPKDQVTAAEFVTLAKRRIRSILRRGKVPFVVGGTGLYVRALIENFSMGEAEGDLNVRETLARRPTASLYAELRKKDADYAARIPKENRRYVIRALEVIRSTGRPFSVQQKRGEPDFDALTIGIARPREEMYRRIDARVDVLMRNGLLKEAERLGTRYGWDLPALSSLGHRQLGMFLRGEMTLKDAVVRIKRDTRRFAKRQMTWFRRERDLRWVAGYAEAKRLVAAHLKGKKGEE